MDKTDRKLIQLLHQNSRISIVNLSKMVNLSRPSVKERINKLVDQGIISNFTIQVSTEQLGQTIAFFTELNQVTLPVEKTLQILKSNPNVNEIHIVSGEVNYLVKTTVKSITEMKNLLAYWMTFANVKSSIILETPLTNQLNIEL